ncbi:MAG TPA: hypothetical protein VLA43_00760 [Longimicrobiales bacterium]|nr:hypothetical protein [Longimicrobiales bacterium]
MTGEGKGGQEVMERAIWRLWVLENLFIALAAVSALVAGALVAWLLGQAFGLPFRPTWAASALLLFILPGGLSWGRVRRDDARSGAERTQAESREDQ